MSVMWKKLVWICLVGLVGAWPCSAEVLRFGTHVSAMGRLDPHFAFGSQDRALADMVFNGLLRYLPGRAPKIGPDLAEALPEFRMEGGEQIWTIRLRKGVMFHEAPGLPAHELTAEDVVFSLEKSADKARSGYSGDYLDMEVVLRSRYQVEIRFAHPISPILFFPRIANYGGGFIVSKQAVETLGYEGFKTHPVGTGPFAFDSHSPGEVLKLKAHAAYFRGAPKLDGVWLYFQPEAALRLAALKAGELDVITGSGKKGWIDQARALEGVVVDTHGVGEVGVFHLNTTTPPFDDIRVRRALAHALDREAFYRTTDADIVDRVFSPIPAPYLPGGLKRQEVEVLGLAYEYDVEKARALLREAGLEAGFDLELVASEKRLYQAYYQTLKAQLAPLNIRCNIETVPHSQMHRIIRSTPPPIVLYPAWRPNADVYLTRFFHSDSRVVTGRRPDTNFSQYQSVDALIDAARREVDPDAQIRLWSQAQIRILHDMVAFPVMATRQIYVRRMAVDYGHPVVSTMALYPQFTERTQIRSGGK